MSVGLALGLVAFGFVTGAASGLLGIGGGTLMVPFLVLVADLSQHSAEATSLLVILPTAIVGTLALRHKKVGDARTGLQIGVLGAIGGLAGAALALSLPGDVLRPIFAVVLGILGIRMSVRAIHRKRLQTAAR